MGTMVKSQSPSGRGTLELSDHFGKTFFVDSNTGLSTNTGRTPERALATLAQALAKCTASVGDRIILAPRHAEAGNGITVDKIGVQIIGLGVGANRPTFTAAAAASDLMSVTAASVLIENVRFIGAASNVTALLDIGAAANFTARNCLFEQLATPLEAITVSGDASNFVIEDCLFLGSTNGPDRAISIEAKCHNWQVRRCKLLYPAGLDNDIIKSVKACTGYLVEDIVAVGLDALLLTFSSSTAGAPDGLFAKVHAMYSAAVTSVEDGVAAATSLGATFSEVYVTDATGKRAGRVPLTSAS